MEFCIPAKPGLAPGFFFRARELAAGEQHLGSVLVVRGIILRCTPIPEVAAAQGLLEILDTKSSDTRIA